MTIERAFFDIDKRKRWRYRSYMENTNNAGLKEAEAKVLEARKAITAAKTKKALNDAHFDLEFWTSKAAFFMYAKGLNA